MIESNEIRIARMLQQGLEFYGAGDFSRALLTWSEVLELDPGNEEALDYLKEADRRVKPRGGALDGVRRSLVDEARCLLRSENAEAALELLVNAGTKGRLDCEAMIELLRAFMFAECQEEFGGLSRVPQLVAGAETELRGRNLPANAGFMLSMIDGQMSIGDLVSVSGMDQFEAMRTISRMFRAGILEWSQ